MILETSSQTGSGQTLYTVARLLINVTKCEQEKHSAGGNNSDGQRIMTLGLMCSVCVFMVVDILSNEPRVPSRTCPLFQVSGVCLENRLFFQKYPGWTLTIFTLNFL
jgi:hypothetical protein